MSEMPGVDASHFSPFFTEGWDECYFDLHNVKCDCVCALMKLHIDT